MSDPKAPDAPKPAEDNAAAANTVRVAKPGVKDKGETVGSAGGELFSGHISDIADGDD